MTEQFNNACHQGVAQLKATCTQQNLFPVTFLSMYDLRKTRFITEKIKQWLKSKVNKLCEYPVNGISFQILLFSRNK